MINRYQLNSILFDIIFNTICGKKDEFKKDDFKKNIDEYCDTLDDTDAEIIINSSLQDLKIELYRILIDSNFQDNVIEKLNICIYEFLGDFALESDKINEDTYTTDLKWFIDKWCEEEYPDIYDLPKILTDKLIG